MQTTVHIYIHYPEKTADDKDSQFKDATAIKT